MGIAGEAPLRPSAAGTPFRPSVAACRSRAVLFLSCAAASSFRGMAAQSTFLSECGRMGSMDWNMRADAGTDLGRAHAAAGRERAQGGGFCCDARQNRCCRSRSIPPAIWFPNASVGVYSISEHALLPSWEEATAKRLARLNHIGKYNKP